MKKKTFVLGMVAGLTSAVVLTTGCSSKKNQLTPVAGAEGLLGSREVIPPPYASPTQMKTVTVTAPAASAQDVPEPGLPEVGTAPLAPVVASPAADPMAPIALAPVAAPAAPSDAIVPPPAPADISPAPAFPNGIQDLSTGGTVPAAPVIPAAPATPVLPNDAAAPAAAIIPAAETLTYTVRKGDTLSSIARQYGVKWQDIVVANNLTNASGIKVGQVLTMPAGAVQPVASLQPLVPSTPLVSPAAPIPSSGKSVKPTQRFTVKPLPADGKYTVMDGDSLWKIAHKYGLTSDSIRKTNNLTSDKLRIGQVLILKKTADAAPANGKSATPSAAKGAKADAKSSAATGLSADKHIVASGDNLWTLARKYKISEKDLWKWNNLKTANLRIGQVLIVRAPAGTANTASAAAPAAPIDAPTAPIAAPAAPIAAPAIVEPVAAPAPVIDLTQPTVPEVAAPAPATTPGTATAVPAVTHISSHTVAEGETVASILQEFAISLEQFKQLNPEINVDEPLKVGSEVKVPFEE